MTMYSGDGNISESTVILALCFWMVENTKYRKATHCMVWYRQQFHGFEACWRK